VVGARYGPDGGLVVTATPDAAGGEANRSVDIPNATGVPGASQSWAMRWCAGLTEPIHEEW
jgi:hypothetical protein